MIKINITCFLFHVFYVPAKEFKITYMACIMYLLESMVPNGARFSKHHLNSIYSDYLPPIKY